MKRSMLTSAVLMALSWLCPASASCGPLEPYAIPPVAPALDLDDLEGQRVSLADFRGEVLLVNFWASWCTPCLREIPSMERLAASLEGRPFHILAVNHAEERRRAQRVAGGMGGAVVVLLDPKGEAFETWGGRVLPTSYIVDPDGKLQYRVQGPFEWDSMEVRQAIEGLIPESPE